MLRQILLACLICLGCSPLACAVTWYACASTVNINAANEWGTASGGSCICTGASTSFPTLSTGDILNANGCTALAVNIDPGSVTVWPTLASDTTNGGYFTLTASSLTLHIGAITGGTADGLRVSGTPTGTSILCSGSGIAGGSATSQHGVYDTRSSGTLTIGSSTYPCNVTGGSGTNNFGYTLNGAASTTLVGNGTIGSASGAAAIFASAAGNITMTGDCTGSDTTGGTYAACQTSSTGYISITGNLINCKKTAAVNGVIMYTPAATNYVLFPLNSSYICGTINANAVEMPTNPGINNVLSGVTYGTYTGTAAGGSSVSTFGGW